MKKREAVIIGVADLPLKDGKALTPMSVLQAQALVARDALKDAGIAMSEVDGLLTTGLWGVPGPGQLPTVTLSEYLGITPRFVDGTWCRSTGGCRPKKWPMSSRMCHPVY